jgi:hypothetical protein
MPRNERADPTSKRENPMRTPWEAAMRRNWLIKTVCILFGAVTIHADPASCFTV